MDLVKVSVSMLNGAVYTILLFIITIIISLPLGLAAAFLSNSRNKIIHSVIRLYVFLMRGTPLLLQLFFVYFGLPFLPYIGKFFVMERFTAACIAFILNYAAYFCEIYRGGLLSIDKGQYEAAKVLGFTKWQMTGKIIVPQMIKVVLPPVSNETITLVKDTALVTSIGVAEMLHMAKTAVNTYANVTPFILAGIFYLIITFALTKMFQYLEKKFMF